MNENFNLVKWDAIRTQIEMAKDIDELVKLKDKLRAYQILAEQSKQAIEVQAQISIYKARADRKCGEWLRDNIKHEGAAMSGWNNGLQAETRLSDIGIEKTESHRLQKIAAIPENKFEEILQEAEEETRRVTSNMLVNIAKEAHAPICTLYTGNQENYTPQYIVDIVKEVLGQIDLDPASCDFANKTIQAKHFYTENDNGLLHSWYGNVFMNPPYQQPIIGQFVDKLISELGNIKSAIVLVSDNTDTKWFNKLANNCKYICFIKNRISFYTKEKERTAPTNGSAIFYFGDDAEKFRDIFKKHGLIMAVVERYYNDL